MFKKVLALIVALCLCLSGAALAEVKPMTLIEADPSMYPNVDFSKHETVVMYLIGDCPNDFDAVLAKINEVLEGKFNTTLQVEFIAWSDTATKYTLTLASGEVVDLIFTAPWNYMYTEAAKGSFMELTDEFIAANMPLTAQYQAPASWDETTLSGKTIAVPCNQLVAQSKYVAVRQDLMEKYGFEKLTSWEDLMSFMLTIAEKETPVSGIYANAASKQNNELWAMYRQRNDLAESGSFAWHYKKDGTLPDSSDITFNFLSDEFYNFCKDMKTLADAGSWSRSAISNETTSYDTFANGNAAMICWNSTVFNYIRTAEKIEGVKCAAYDLTPESAVFSEAYSNNDMAIPDVCEIPERAAMVLDVLKFDTALNALVLFGIEGQHWIDNGDGTYSDGEKLSDYAHFPISLSWAIKNGNWDAVYSDLRQKEMDDQIKVRAIASPLTTFVFDSSSVKAYESAINAVVEEYRGVLTLGLVDDVDAAFAEMRQKLNDAGLEIYQAEFLKQYEAWKATR